jgi:hypothetical protein
MRPRAARTATNPLLTMNWTSFIKALTNRSSIATHKEIRQIRDYLLSYGVGETKGGICRVASSSAVNGGKGVYLQRDVKKGELLTLYGGIQFPQPPLGVATNDMGDQEKAITPIVDCSDYILNLGGLGKGYLDGFGSEIQNRKCGQIINHPPEGIRPNVDAIEFMWTSIWADASSDEDKDLLQKVAHGINTIYQGPWYHDGDIVHTPAPGDSDYNLYYAGIAMVAKQDLKAHSELFLDYELNERLLDSHTREWYTPVPFRLNE